MSLERQIDEKIYTVLHFIVVQNNNRGARIHLQELADLLHICYVCKGKGEVHGDDPTIPPQQNWIECPKCGGSGKLK